MVPSGSVCAETLLGKQEDEGRVERDWGSETLGAVGSYTKNFRFYFLLIMENHLRFSHRDRNSLIWR